MVYIFMQCFTYFKISRFDFDLCFPMTVAKLDVACVAMETVILAIHWRGGDVSFVGLTLNVHTL